MAYLLHLEAAIVATGGRISDTPPSATGRWREIAVALSVLRAGLGTRGARLVKEFTDSRRQPPIQDEDLLERLAESLQIPRSERTAQLAESRRCALEYLKDGARHGLEPLTRRDAAYPALLHHIVDPPVVLWVRGALAILDRPAVAIVGSRNATPSGLTIARQLAGELARVGFVIVSGLARGVDAAAHEGTLDAGGQTVGVLGSGGDVIYPREHAALAMRIATTGVIASEFAPGTEPLKGHFPMRNRIISGMSLAVVVIEATDKSGSLITARMALEQGREVLAVPGGVLSGRSRGCHQLIRDGARLVETAADVLDQLGWARTVQPAVAGPTNSLQLNELEETMALGEPYSVEELAGQIHRPVSALLADLGALEVAGRIVRTAGGRYVRLD